MKSGIGCIAGAVLATVLAAPALAQHAPVVVDGNMWMNSPTETRKAFLLGAGSMIALESTYAKKKGTPPPVAGAMTTNAVEDLTFDEISNRITRWYENNPDRRNMPVMAVLWVDMVAPRAAGK